MAKESNKERALTLEAIRVLDAIDRRGSFAAAADELGKVPSALSYTVQKLEDELDAMLFDRSGHRTKFTPAGRMLLERGRVLLEAAEHLVGETRALSRGWETDITIAVDALMPVQALYPLVDRLAEQTDTRLRFRAEVLAGSWECLEDGRADLLISSLNPDIMMTGIKHQPLQEEVDDALPPNVHNISTAAVAEEVDACGALHALRGPRRVERRCAAQDVPGRRHRGVPSAMLWRWARW